MKRLRIVKSRALPASEALDKFEEDNGFRLPLPYRKFLLEQNPYTVQESQFNRDGRIFSPHHFYPFDPDFELSLQQVYSRLNSWFENNYIAFADDAGGWQFLVSVQKPDYGKVYFCRMDTSLPEALTLLADSFDEFVNGMK